MPTELEDQFIRFARGPRESKLFHVKQNELIHSNANGDLLASFDQAGLVSGMWATYTPRGRDLLATADAINYDPDAKAEPVDKQPETVPCTDCKGRGRVPLSELQGTQDRNMKELVEGPDGRRSTQVEREEPVLLAGWDVTCTTCKGLKVVPAVHPPAFVDRFIDYQPLPLRWQGPRASYPSAESKSVPKPYSDHPIYALAVQLHASAKTRTLTDTKISIGPGGTKLESAEASDGWIPFDTYADVEGLEGKEVDVRHRDGSCDNGHIRKIGSNGSHSWIEFEITGRSFSNGIGWEIRPRCAGAL